MVGASIEERRKCLTLEERESYIKGLCLEAEATGVKGIKGWHAKKQLFSSDLDFEKLAKYSHEVSGGGKLDGPALAPQEMTAAVINAILEKNPEREKGGLGRSAMVTTEHILFQFYLIKRDLRSKEQ